MAQSCPRGPHSRDTCTLATAQPLEECVACSSALASARLPWWGASAVDGDVIPYGLVAGNRATLRGVNLVGLRRDGRSMFTLEQIKFLMAAQRYLFPAVSGSNGGVGGGDGGGCHPQRSSLVPCPFVLPWHDLLEERAGELTGAIKGGLRLGVGRDGVAGDRGSEEHRNEIKLALDVLLAIRGRKKVLMASGV